MGFAGLLSSNTKNNFQVEVSAQPLSPEAVSKALSEVQDWLANRLPSWSKELSLSLSTDATTLAPLLKRALTGKLNSSLLNEWASTLKKVPPSGLLEAWGPWQSQILQEAVLAYKKHPQHLDLLVGALTQTSQALLKTALNTSLQAELDKNAHAKENHSSQTSELQGQVYSINQASEQMNLTVTTVATAIEEMSASMNDISNNAARAADVSNQAEQTVNSSLEAVHTLETAAREITGVVELIKTIANQTNLLALNATIEAARAGEAGKGFAVVASEVKELARQSSTATEGIKNRVNQIQEGTHKAIASMQQITEIVSQLTQFNNNIAAAVEEQSVVTNDISRNMAQAATSVDKLGQTVSQLATTLKS